MLLYQGDNHEEGKATVVNEHVTWVCIRTLCGTDITTDFVLRPSLTVSGLKQRELDLH